MRTRKISFGIMAGALFIVSHSYLLSAIGVFVFPASDLEAAALSIRGFSYFIMFVLTSIFSYYYFRKAIR